MNVAGAMGLSIVLLALAGCGDPPPDTGTTADPSGAVLPAQNTTLVDAAARSVQHLVAIPNGAPAIHLAVGFEGELPAATSGDHFGGINVTVSFRQDPEMRTLLQWQRQACGGIESSWGCMSQCTAGVCVPATGERYIVSLGEAIVCGPFRAGTVLVADYDLDGTVGAIVTRVEAATCPPPND